MRRVESELDEFVKKTLEPLRPAPPLDPNILADEKARYLLRGENLRQGLIPYAAATRARRTTSRVSSLWGSLNSSLSKAFAIAILVLILLVGSTFTVYAAQSSLPGQALYPIKSLSEDIRFNLTASPEAKLNLTLAYTNRRVGEIQSLLARGKSLPVIATDRYQNELDEALQLAAQLNNQQLLSALYEIKIRAEDQNMTMEQLAAKSSHQAAPAILHLQERLQEQVQLSTIGERNPQQFRLEMQERAHNRRGPKNSPTSDEWPFLLTATAMPFEAGNEKENGQGTQLPGHNGNGQGQSNPGNGNHGPNPTHAP